MQETDDVCDYCKGQIMTYSSGKVISTKSLLCAGCYDHYHFEGKKVLLL